MWLWGLRVWFGAFPSCAASSEAKITQKVTVKIKKYKSYCCAVFVVPFASEFHRRTYLVNISHLFLDGDFAGS